MRNQITGEHHSHHIVDVESVRYGLDMVCFTKIIDVHAVMVSWPWSLDLIKRKRGTELKKLPAKIQAIKNLFKGDNDYNITTGIDPETNIRSITIWWK